jgi:hypothetical protein
MSEAIYTQEQYEIGLLKQQQSMTSQTLLSLDRRMDYIEREMKANFYWLLGAMASMAFIMAHGFKWF